MNVIGTLKAKALSILLVILLTMLVALKVDYNDKVVKLESATSSLVKTTDANKRLSDENIKLIEELKTKPKETLKIVKEVQKELCNIPAKVEAIKSLPSKKKEVTNEEDVADIDARLPDDLLRLLQ